MIHSVPVLMIGIVIISAIGTVFGYLLEPGRFEKRDAAEVAVNPTGAHADTHAKACPPRLAA